MKHNFSPSARLQHTLQLQALGIEAVLRASNIRARVMQAASQPGWVRFELLGSGEVESGQLSFACRRVRELLAVERVALARQEFGWQLDVVQRQPQGQALLDLLTKLPSSRPGLALLGLSESGRSLYLDFDRPESQHVLVHGRAGCGKTSLLRAVVLALTLTNRQADVQVIVLTASGAATAKSKSSQWHGFNFIPHLIGAVRQGTQAGIEALGRLRAQAERRRRERFRQPRIVLVCDDLPELLSMCGSQAAAHLAYLLHQGARTGVHVLAAAREEQLAALPASVRLGFRLLLTGRDAGVPAELGGRREGHSAGKGLHGAFVATSGQRRLALQTPYLSDYDLHYALQQLLRRKQPALCARRLPKNRVQDGLSSAGWDQAVQVDSVLELVPDPLGI